MSCVWFAEVTVRDQLPDRLSLGTNGLTRKLEPKLEQHALLDLKRERIKLDPHGSHKLVVGNSRRRLGINESADSVVRLLTALFKKKPSAFRARRCRRL